MLGIILPSSTILPLSCCLPITAAHGDHKPPPAMPCHTGVMDCDGITATMGYDGVCLLAFSTTWIIHKSVARSSFSYPSFRGISHFARVSSRCRSCSQRAAAARAWLLLAQQVTLSTTSALPLLSWDYLQFRKARPITIGSPDNGKTNFPFLLSW